MVSHFTIVFITTPKKVGSDPHKYPIKGEHDREMLVRKELIKVTLPP
jgi:hypothetical protein